MHRSSVTQRLAPRPLLLLVAALGLTAVATCSAASDMPATATPDPGSNVVATIGDTRITEAQLVSSQKALFDELQSQYERGVNQLNRELAQSRYDLEQRLLDKMLNERALALESKATNISVPNLLGNVKAAVVTEDQARAFYDANTDRIKQPYDQVAPQVHQYLAKQRADTATRDFYDGLRAKHGIKSQLGPLRLAVDQSGPARGPAHARITIVEFGDFQCPICKEAETSVRAILARYPNDVRLVFRNLPLTRIHPNAHLAALASVCADHEGKFWDMHDAMYGNQSALNLDALKDTAQRLGMDAGRFSACLSDHSTEQVLATDSRAADRLGLTSTPFFFVDGRPIDGSVPLDRFESIITDELARGGHDQG